MLNNLYAAKKKYLITEIQSMMNLPDYQELVNGSFLTGVKTELMNLVLFIIVDVRPSVPAAQKNHAWKWQMKTSYKKGTG